MVLFSKSITFGKTNVYSNLLEQSLEFVLISNSKKCNIYLHKFKIVVRKVFIDILIDVDIN